MPYDPSGGGPVPPSSSTICVPTSSVGSLPTHLPDVAFDRSAAVQAARACRDLADDLYASASTLGTCAVPAWTGKSAEAHRDRLADRISTARKAGTELDAFAATLDRAVAVADAEQDRRTSANAAADRIHDLFPPPTPTEPPCPPPFGIFP